MTTVTNPTTPASSTSNSQGGQNIIGTTGNNKLNGTTKADIILTLLGEDEVAAGDGNDLVLTGGGNDTVGGGAGNDTAFAGSGNDVVAGRGGDDLLFGGKGNDLVDGGDGNDILSGDQGNDTVSGGAGNDTIFGGSGNDIISGGDGDDCLFGGQGNDTVDGGAGNDFISGDRGSDVLTGGAGSDTFYFASIGSDNSGKEAYGVDTITDFTPADDKIRLKSGGAFAGLGSSFDSTEFIVDAAFNTSSPTAGTTNKLVYNPTSGLLYFNSGSGVLTVAQLQTGLTITSSNFELF